MAEKENQLAKLEALLFIHGEPISMKKISLLLDVSAENAEALVSGIEAALKDQNRGLVLIKSGGKVQLATKSEFAPMLEEFIKAELSENLTPAALEVLTIISYLGPVAKSKIEYIRGVNSSFMLRNLMLRGLVERAADPDRPQSFVYKLTFESLRHLGVTNESELPDYENAKSVLGRAGEIQTQEFRNANPET